MSILATINDPKLLPYGVYVTPDSFVIHDRKYRPIARFAAHEDQDETFEDWGDAHLPGGIYCDASFTFIRVKPETAQVVAADEWIEHDRENRLYLYEGEPDRTKLKELVDQFPEMAAEIQRRAAEA